MTAHYEPDSGRVSPEQSVIDHFTDRMLPLESAEETLDRIEKYLTSEYLQPRTSIPMALAAIRKWRGSTGEVERLMPAPVHREEGEGDG